MSDELCVNIFDEISQTTGNLATNIFQGLGNQSGGFFTFIVFLMLAMTALFVANIQLREREKIGLT